MMNRILKFATQRGPKTTATARTTTVNSTLILRPTIVQQHWVLGWITILAFGISRRRDTSE